MAILTKKDYCDYDTCVALMEIGYPPYAFGDELRDEHFANISLYEAQKWLREERGIEILVHSFDYVGEPYFADIHMYREERCACNYATSYEEALSKGIKEAVKILKGR